MAASLVWVGALCTKETRSCTFLCHFVHKLGARVTHYCVSAQNEHVAPGAQIKHKPSTHQAQISCSFNGRTQAHRSPLRGVCALLHSLKHLGIWHSCILVFCFLNSFLQFYIEAIWYMFTLLFITPHPLQERSKKYISWVGGGSFGPNLTFQQCKKYACPCIYINCFLVLSVSITCLPWVEGIIPRSYVNDLVSWNKSFWQIPTTNNNV